MADSRHNRSVESLYKNSHLLRLSYKRTWLMTATIEGMKVFIKTAICGDFHITAMAVPSATTKHESP
ncbi:hypothetical protein MTBBW1_850010 [Desulfamplus magnetovallimortis]|uniref:Uncharacterized protein n=1 Tax=Desulfamplus magnetovallimortis TaxID=1246637 RepID=A0A1W1HKW6_9BACT|nr:hypothetical protein MTBBW1_850010 [Desulfamplus magnetovallimortis]